MIKKSLYPLLLVIITGTAVLGQQVPSYNQFFFNPSIYNPSFFGQSGYTELNINHRQQWVGIEGAPVTSNVNFQAPLSDQLALGVILFSDKRGLITTYESTVGLSYSLKLGPESRLAFGLTAGVGRNDIDFTLNDQAVSRALEKSFYASGQFGVNYTYNRLTIAFALPQLVESQFLKENHFDELGIEAAKLTFSSVSYKFNLSYNVTLEPTIFYQSDKDGVDQLGGLAVVKYNDTFWAGGGYKDELGANAFVGFNVNDFIKVGYSYDFAPEIATELGEGTHEFQIGIRLGKTNKRAPKVIVAKEPDVPVISEEEDEEEVTKEEPVEALQEDVNPQITEEEEVSKEEPIVEEEIKEPIVEPEEPAKEEVIAYKPGEMQPGYYVVVGAYRSKQNAEVYLNKVKAAGYQVAMGYQSATQLNYIYTLNSPDRYSAMMERAKIRMIHRFEFDEAWILTIQK